jgi:hypothetical protein
MPGYSRLGDTRVCQFGAREVLRVPFGGRVGSHQGRVVHEQLRRPQVVRGLDERMAVEIERCVLRPPTVCAGTSCESKFGAGSGSAGPVLVLLWEWTVYERRIAGAVEPSPERDERHDRCGASLADELSGVEVAARTLLTQPEHSVARLDGGTRRLRIPSLQRGNRGHRSRQANQHLVPFRAIDREAETVP